MLFNAHCQIDLRQEGEKKERATDNQMFPDCRALRLNPADLPQADVS